MVSSKKTKKKVPTRTTTTHSSVSTSSHHRDERVAMSSENLYIALDDAVEKRKEILACVKTSLLVQEDYERILELRKEKLKHMNAVKRDMESLSVLYQQLKKLIPNLNSAILSTEKELGAAEERIEEKEGKKKELEMLQKGKLEEELSSIPTQPLSSQMKAPLEKKTKLTRLDRIKNNLQVIEAKLKNS